MHFGRRYNLALKAKRIAFKVMLKILMADERLPRVKPPSTVNLKLKTRKRLVNTGGSLAWYISPFFGTTHTQMMRVESSGVPALKMHSWLGLFTWFASHNIHVIRFSPFSMATPWQPDGNPCPLHLGPRCKFCSGFYCGKHEAPAVGPASLRPTNWVGSWLRFLGESGAG